MTTSGPYYSLGLTRLRNEIVSLYKSGKNTPELAILYNCRPQSINYQLHRAGIELRQEHRYYTINNSFFENIDNEYKAYWFGFLLADGSIQQHRIILGLSVKDKKHIQLFQQHIKSNHPIKYRKTKNKGKIIGKVAIVDIGCLKLIEQLKQLAWYEFKKGISPIAFEKVPIELRRHMIRGFFDGDGCITKNRTSTHMGFERKIKFCGSEDTMKWIISYLYNNQICKTINKKISYNKRKTLCTVDWSGDPLSQRFYNLIYLNSLVYLKRKKIRFETSDWMTKKTGGKNKGDKGEKNV